MEAQDVLCRVFRPDPKARIALPELRRHPWLSGSSTSAPLAYGIACLATASL